MENASFQNNFYGGYIYLILTKAAISSQACSTVVSISTCRESLWWSLWTAFHLCFDSSLIVCPHYDRYFCLCVEL